MKPFLIIQLAATLLFSSEFKFESRDSELSRLLTFYSQAVDGNKTVVESTLKKVQKLIKKSGETYERKAYEGSLIAMKAKYTKLIWRKKAYAQKGAKVIDYAIENEPWNIALRFNRFFVYKDFPKTESQDDKLKKDFLFILKKYEENKIEKKDLDNTYGVFAIYYNRTGDTKQRDRYLSKIKNKKLAKELETSFKKEAKSDKK